VTLADEPCSYPVTRSEERFAGAVISVRTDWVRMPSGDIAAREVVTHPGSVGVIALDDAERVLLVRQYRHPPARLLWEPPAGILDQPAEAALTAAQRELYEEAGYRAREWHVLVDAYTTPGNSDEALRIFLARGLEPVGEHERHVGEHEEADMPVEWLQLDAAVESVLAGRLTNPTAVMGLLAAHLARASRWTGLRPADAPWAARPSGGGSKA
jgi:ADP-ribose pyrophosphatase